MLESVESVWFWVIWTSFLMVQNASFTMVSRARNSGSIIYHAVAAIGSNGIWFVSQLFLFSAAIKLLLVEFSAIGLLFLGIYYTTITVFSSVSMHWFLLKKETGKGKARH